MIQQLIEKIKKTKAPICVGLDPMLSYIPEHILKKSYAEFGETLEGAADAIWQFNKEIVDNTFDLIPSTSAPPPRPTPPAIWARCRWEPRPTAASTRTS